MKNILYRLKCSIKFRLALLIGKTVIIEDDRRCCGKSYLINKLSKKYKLNIIRGRSFDVDKQAQKWIGVHYDVILLDSRFRDKQGYNLIRRNISNLNSYSNIVIGFNTYVGNNKWKNY